MTARLKLQMLRRQGAARGIRLTGMPWQTEASTALFCQLAKLTDTVKNA